MTPLGLGAGFYGLGGISVGGDGTGAIWTPRKLGVKMIHWYRFNTGITTATVDDTAGFVSVWADQVGSNDLAPSADDDASEMPFLESDGTLFFQQNTDSLVFQSALSLGAFAIYVKHNMKSGQTVSSEVMMEGSSDSIKLASPTEARVKVSSRQDFTINEIVEGTPYVLGVERAANGDISVFKDNNAGTAADGDDLNEAISTTFDITQLGDAIVQSYWYEVVICDAALSATERKNLYTYLSNVG